MGRKLGPRGAEKRLRHAFHYLRLIYTPALTGPDFYGLAGAMHEIYAAHFRVAPEKRRLKWEEGKHG